MDEIAIRARTGSRVFARGEDYWKHGAVLSLVKREDSLRAKVEGSGEEPYRVVIRWQPDGEVEVGCDCPYAEDWDDWCKHIVAVLLELLVAVSEREPKFYEAVVAQLNGEEPEDDEIDY